MTCRDHSSSFRPRNVIVLALFVSWAWVLPISAMAQALEAERAEPRTYAFLFDDWQERHSEQATTPEGAIKVWFDAIFLYLDPETRDLGRTLLQYSTVPLKDDDQWHKRPSFSIFLSRLEDESHHHIFRSYAKGATPENGYSMNPRDYELRIESSGKDTHGRGWRLSLESGGADNPRPVYLRRSSKSELYFVDGFVNVYLGIRPPIDPEKERFE